MKISNLFTNIPNPSKDEFFENIIKNDKVKIQRIVSHGHTSPKEGWYEATNEEWVILLEGAATLSFKNGEDISLSIGDYINIPAHSEHKVSWTKPECNTIWLVIHY